MLSVGAVSAQSMPQAGPARAIVEGLSGLLTNMETTVMATAESVPDSLYAYRATSEVRTFGQILAHIADSQKALCEGTHGNNVNLTDTFEKTATTRPAIIAALKETFAGCRQVLAGMTDAEAARAVPFGKNSSPKATILAFTISHTNEHYGNLVTYMRLNSIVPPSSRPAR